MLLKSVNICTVSLYLWMDLTPLLFWTLWSTHGIEQENMWLSPLFLYRLWRVAGRWIYGSWFGIEWPWRRGPHNMHTFRWRRTKRRAKLVRSLWKEKCATALPNRRSWASRDHDNGLPVYVKRRAINQYVRDCYLAKKVYASWVEIWHGSCGSSLALPPRKQAFYLRAIHKGFVVDKVALGQGFLLVL